MVRQGGLPTPRVAGAAVDECLVNGKSHACERFPFLGGFEQYSTPSIIIMIMILYPFFFPKKATSSTLGVDLPQAHVFVSLVINCEICLFALISVHKGYLLS